MKKLRHILAICLLLVGSYSAKAQTPPDSTSGLKEMLEWMYAPLDTSHFITTGLLMDKGLMDSSLFWYRGLATDSLSFSSGWYQLYYNSYNAQVDKDTSIVPIENVYSLAGSYIDNGYIPLMGLWFDYNHLHPEAFDSGWVDTSGGQVFTTGIANPFLTDSLFSIASPIDDTYAFSDTLKLIFPSELFFTNRVDGIDHMEISINGGEWQQMDFNSEILIMGIGEIAEIGEKQDFEINLRIYVYQGFILNSKFNIGVIRADEYDAEITTIVADRAIVGDTPAKGYAPIKFGKDKYGTKHTCLTKPLIIVEGIDFGTKEHPTGCRNGKCGEIGLVDILNGDKNYEKYPEFENGPLLIATLEAAGYDIIYLDFEDGATYMEDNAMVLVKLIQHINQWKCSNEEILVAGVSMGGQVAKYALSYMEHNNMPHCVRTYVSFDSPHKGANVPLGFQHLAKFFKGLQSEAKHNYKNKLQRPATRQLLLNHCDRENGSADNLRTEFMQRLNDVGNYPTLCRNIAIANGSRIGQDMGFNPGDRLLSWHHRGWVVNYGVDVDIYALCGKEIDFGSGYWDRIIFNGVIKSFIGIIGINWYSRTKLKPSNCVSTDHVPGGYREDIKSQAGYQLIYKVFYLGKIKTYNDKECFIPTISSLDINTSDYFYDIKGNIDPPEIPHPSLYPFQSYYAPDNNQKHVYISPANIAWLVGELAKNDIGMAYPFAGTYNFGEPLKDRLPGVYIGSGAVVQINGNYATGDGSGSTVYVPEQGSTMSVVKRGCNNNVVVDNGGNFIIGDNNGANNNKGIVYMTDESILTIETGGTLRINNGSKLVIEEGAELVIHQGAIILLEGEDAKIEILGKLRLQNGAVFNPQKGSASHVGYVHFIRPSGFTGNQIVAEGNTSSIQLTGSGKNNLLLKVEGGELQIPHPASNPGNYVASVAVTDGLIVVSQGSSLKCGSDIAYENVRTRGGGAGLVLCGQSNYSFLNTDFRELATGIQVINVYSDRMEFLDILFKNNSYAGIVSDQSSLILDNCSFYYNNQGVLIQSPAAESEITNSMFGFNATAVAQAGNGLLYIEETIILNANNGIGISFNAVSDDGGSLVLACTKLYSNAVGIEAGVNTEINLSTSTASGTAPYYYGGNNSFWVNGNSIRLNTSLLYLKDGYNNFIGEPSTGGSPPYHFVTGTIPDNITANIDATDNYWYPSPPGSDIISGGADYFSIGNYSGAPPPHLTTIKLHGDILANVNSQCYEDPENTIWYIPLSRSMPEDGNPKPQPQTAFILYPNPVNDILVIETAQDKLNPTGIDDPEKNTIKSVELYDVQGKRLAKGSLNSGHWEISTQKLAEGIYIVRVMTGNSVYNQYVRVLR
ncbi:MAG: T9SS type A sorting domain-containing protein [Bacteroidia bacterium]|nr:T9SS type A sorting domain-containing protein [Bacteroidia bacterium]MCO5253660.1 T9SS type A sorting domain-containing protein [Bacteroidota bacterium]